MNTGRTYALASTGMILLSVIAAALIVALFWCLAKPADLAGVIPSVLTTLGFCVGALGGTSFGGAWAHGRRHAGAAEPSSSLSKPMGPKP